MAAPGAKRNSAAIHEVEGMNKGLTRAFYNIGTSIPKIVCKRTSEWNIISYKLANRYSYWQKRKKTTIPITIISDCDDSYTEGRVLPLLRRGYELSEGRHPGRICPSSGKR
ncbi:hypothetical protein E2C01_102120 [Portunus trituberculatus]|uniref:Uncharacterized protein n=1 Tax=Portunus trituberculatus TaxID=210409 RepID=A0A5B7KNG7_PORTR|nr:hypothetical protein [Portunus trituberculatus]